ncbi:NADPH:adrenodoxin oxidoreductase [Emiliania huxleyi CCMP1516]|uniref:NADPH:adrenodoxin oxidoreductase, mitochondrial n=2 Tax=Emiliania huxleyi TaxID=2903 RepID=A0A0D3K2Q5_EMIH1|nr:NADPH:adrenodoxin oxidoreductase [Emiliania huxleyi CCMP1516]EOD30040.1 NADPH:adrenodoxin oxidoreductase [Emiliania huxleyi CCMP1516]|eukprot:XP_005782469.1 NADPH:adrenodoxin oxidoreductase [Emiliania huxleyi CCMP1516]
MRVSVRRFSSSTARWNVAIVGSGPAGFYAADFLLKKNEHVHVTMFERLPAPYGLVRYGVAPDHPEVKNVTDRFEEIASHERFSYFGNVSLGPRIEIAALRSAYDAVLLSYGASASRSLGTVVVVGNGNVALDCARVLAKDVDELAPTDICERAVEALRASAVRQVAILGRRGVLQAAFTIKELRELTKLARVSTSIEAPPDAFSAAVLAAAAEDRPRKRLVELMKSLVPEGGSGGGGGAERRSVRLQFQRSPVEFVEGGSGRLGAVRVAATELQGAPGASQRAAAVAGSEEEVPCELALTSVGYRSLPIEGVPLVKARGVVPNEGGRVSGEAGLYVAGWLKRGPSGVILTNVGDAAESVAALLSDHAGGLLPESGGGGDDEVRELLAQHGGPVVEYEGVRRLVAEEARRGAADGKVAHKLVDLEEMIEVARG